MVVFAWVMVVGGLTIGAIAVFLAVATGWQIGILNKAELFPLLTAWFFGIFLLANKFL